MEFQKITPYLWYDSQALEAAEFYCSIFKNSEIISTSEKATEFNLEGINFVAFNGGPYFEFNESFSLFISCENQEEIDHLWNILTKNGGSESRCGWCKDKFGLSWQIVPQRFLEMMKTGSEKQIKNMFDKLMTMNKIVIEDLEKAFSKL